ncbi:MAG: hypothetical protein KKA79_02205, partial [Nanoarchaeota archaeon]|nr:hypothetical protein [Nanoarchaeota archaeon]
PTNAGILLFGKKPQRFFMNSYIAIARYRKNVVGSERLDYKEFDGNIFSQIDKAVKYIINNTAVMSRLIPGRVEREDIPEYPLFSIREIITNAITHRDYRQESKVIIKIFSNRIEVYNPGGLLAGITPKNIVNKQYSRNPVLARVLNKVRYIEELGEGWDKIIEEHKKHHLRPKIPSIKDVGKAVIVNMFSVKDKFVETKIEQYDLNERQRFVLDYLKSKIFIRSIDIQKEFDVTRDTANRDINGLIKLTLIRREGIGKSTRYKLK